MEEKQEPTTVKRPSSEQRKLRSRDAARYRRSQETEVFYELAHTLPLPRRVSTHLDKSAIMRASLSFLWLRRVLQSAVENPTEESQEKEEDPMDSFYPQVLSGFIMVITEEGDLIYLTENVSRYIGITQLELLGQSVVDFVHPCDQEHLRDLLAPRPGGNKKQLTEQPSERNFFLRMKSTLTSRGRTVNIKSASWKVLHCTGQMRPFGGHSRSPPAPRVMTLLCEPIPHPSSVEFPLDASTFLTRHSMDLHFTQCEGRVTELVGYKPDDLIGRSAYGFYHTFDSDHVSKSLRTLFSKGQVSTSQYRFLAKSGGFVWAETQATVLYNSKTSQPEAIVCLNFILSAVEQPDIIFSIEQIRHSKTEAHSAELAPEVCETAESCEPEPVDQHLTGSSPTKNTDSNASSAAELFFKLKEKPEELLQLAPEAGEVVPLSDFAELSFFSLPITTSVPNRPQDICTPQLLQLLSPIFSNTLPSSSSPASSLDPLISGDLPQSSCEPDMIDTSRVEKFFAICSLDGQKKEETLKEVDEMDLEMLAPYISMDDDFQLTVLSSLPEEDDKPSSSSSEPSAVVQTVPAGRKRTHDLDEAMLSQLMIQDKRQKRGATLIEEDLLLNHKSLCCLYETDLSNLVLEAGPAGLNILLTDRDPLLGGGQGLCDTAALMKDIFIPHSPDLSPPLSSLT